MIGNNIEKNDSVLGTQEYWQQIYQKELQNWNSDNLVGEIWFGEEVQKIHIEFMNQILEYLNKNNSSICDLGCGNGMLSIKLKEQGWKSVTGIDYCKESIDLAYSIAQKYFQKNERYDEIIKDLQFIQDDILNTQLKQNQYDIVVDKGTFDAISLIPDQNDFSLLYSTNVAKILKQNSYLIITSCNFTLEELIELLQDHFQYFNHSDKHEKIQFGGFTGTKYCTVAFTKK